MYKVGIDETGYGAIAGPITVCVAYVKPEWEEQLRDLNIRDPNKMAASRCQEILEFIKETNSVAWAISSAPPGSIEIMTPFDALCKSARTALVTLALDLGCTLADLELTIDGNKRLMGLPAVVQAPIVGADDKILEVSIAALLAKIHRDFIMVELSGRYPIYHWDTNKGHPDIEHLEALFHYGPSPEHRMHNGVKRAVLRHWEKHYKPRCVVQPAWFKDAELGLYSPVVSEAKKKLIRNSKTNVLYPKNAKYTAAKRSNVPEQSNED